MKIAIIGYGKMGKMIEEVARERGHEIVAIVDTPDEWEVFESRKFHHADVAIEFSIPSAAVDNVLKCFAAGVPVVSGTTGWQRELPEMKEICDKGKGTLLHSSNFSIGVNIFRAVNRRLAELMKPYPQYKPSMEEVHHIHKLDHPSGTAITLAEDIISVSDRLGQWEEVSPVSQPEEGAKAPAPKAVGEDTLPVGCRREGEVPGIHSVCWDSPEDSITLTHSAKSRRGFALGAVIAAEWLAGKQGFFSMADLLGF